MSDNPHVPSEISVTIKHDGKFDSPWIVFKGTVASVKTQIIEAFGLEGAAEFTLAELTLEAASIAKGTRTAAKGLGGRVVKEGTDSSEPTGKAAWNAAKGAPEPPSRKDELLAEIASEGSIDRLKRLWAENQDEFKDAELTAAWSAKGKALKEAVA